MAELRSERRKDQRREEPTMTAEVRNAESWRLLAGGSTDEYKRHRPIQRMIQSMAEQVSGISSLYNEMLADITKFHDTIERVDERGERRARARADAARAREFLSASRPERSGGRRAPCKSRDVQSYAQPANPLARLARRRRAQQPRRASREARRARRRIRNAEHCP